MIQKKLISFSLFSLLICSLVFAQTQTSQTKPSGKHQPKTEDFKLIIKQYYDAWNTLNLDKPAVYYAKDADLIFYDITPLQYRGWSEYRQGVENLLKGYSSFKLVPNDDLKIGRQGRVTWTTLTFHIVATTKDGKKSDIQCRHTAIWQKMHGEWLIVHEHVSVPLNMAAQ